MKIYYAAPLFTNAEREWNAKLVAKLREKGLTIYLPQEHDFENAKDIFNNCIENIDDSDLVLAIMDGSDPDSGTSFECGYAYGKCRTVVTVRTDFRYSGDSFENRFNLMLTEASWAVVDNDRKIQTFDEIVEGIWNKLEWCTKPFGHRL